MSVKDRMTQTSDLIHHTPKDWCDLISTPTVISTAISQPLPSYTVISFKEGSTLKEYIERKSLVPKTFYTIGEVVAILMKVIIKEKMYD